MTSEKPPKDLQPLADAAEEYATSCEELDAISARIDEANQALMAKTGSREPLGDELLNVFKATSGLQKALLNNIRSERKFANAAQDALPFLAPPLTPEE